MAAHLLRSSLWGLTAVPCFLLGKAPYLYPWANQPQPLKPVCGGVTPGHSTRVVGGFLSTQLSSRVLRQGMTTSLKFLEANQQHSTSLLVSRMQGNAAQLARYDCLRDHFSILVVSRAATRPVKHKRSVATHLRGNQPQHTQGQ